MLRRLTLSHTSAPRPRFPRALQIALAVCALALSAIPGNAATPSAGYTSVPAHQWAVDAANNEVKVIEYEQSYLRYKAHIINSKGDETRDVMETRDGTVARLIARSNRPLTAEEDAAEHERLQAMLDSPSAFARHIRSDVSGKKLAVDMIKLMPDAMLFDYTPGQPQRARPGVDTTDPEVVIDFHPNPSWNPPTMASSALTGLRGRLWIDAHTHHMMRMEGQIFQSVNVGWGMLAHLYPGGNLSLEQIRAGENRWLFSHFVEHIMLRAMMVKTIKEDAEIQASDLQPISGMTYQEAIRVLEATPLPGHVQ